MTGLSIELESTWGAPFRARQAIRERLANSLPEPVVHDLCVIVSELVGNSIKHGPPKPIQLRIDVAGDGAALRGEVEDEGERAAAMLESEWGLGLSIVEVLASDWGAHPGSTHVWFELSWA